MIRSLLRGITRFFDATIFSIEWVVFLSRWAIIAPMSVGLLAACLVYEYNFFVSLFELFHKAHEESEMLMLTILGVVDQYMVANLIYTIYAGGWMIFVRNPKNPNEKPRVLDKLNSGTLKIKMSTSLIGITGVHLLKDFLNAEQQDWSLLMKRVTVHLVFLVSTIALCVADRMVLHPAGHDDEPAKDKHEPHTEAH